MDEVTGYCGVRCLEHVTTFDGVAERSIVNRSSVFGLYGVKMVVDRRLASHVVHTQSST